MDEITIFETDLGVFLTHFKDDDVCHLSLTDFSDEMRPGDIFRGHVQRLEGSRAWIDIGFTKAALLKCKSQLENPLSIGKSICVVIDRVHTTGKGAQVQLASSTAHKKNLLDLNLQKIYSAPEEWQNYIQQLNNLEIKTNSSRIFHELQKHNNKIILKSDLIPSEHVYNAWNLNQEKQVAINGGGWLLIEEGETLTAIDVNTGGGEFSSKDLKEDHHWLNFNQKCAKVIMQQIKLRQLGGIIVIDFPRLKKTEHQQILYRTIKKYVDIKTQVLGFTRGGLFELTREKSQNSLAQRLKKTSLWASFSKLNYKEYS